MKSPILHPRVKQWMVILLFAAELYLLVFPSIAHSAMITMSFPGDRWQIISFFITAQYCGTLIALFVAPFVDNYLAHERFTTITTALSTITALACYGLYFVRLIDTMKMILLFECFISLAHPFFFVNCMTVLHSIVKFQPKFVFTCLISVTKIILCAGQMYQLWNPVQMSTLSQRLIVMSIPIIFVQLIIAFTKYKVLPVNSEKGDTFRTIACIIRAVPQIPTGFESMLTRYSYKTVNDGKKTAKIFMVLATLSLNMSMMNFIDLPWIFQYASSIRQGFAVWMDFTSTSMLLSAVFIPAVEFVVIPWLSKISLVPVLSKSITLGYVFSTLSLGFSLNLQSKADAVNFRRMNANSARVFLYNAMDSFTYILSEGTTKTPIPPASIQAFTLFCPNSHFPITLTAMNIYNNVRYEMVLQLKPLTSTAFVMTDRGHYQIPAVGLVRQSTVTPGSLAYPTLSFLCPTDLDIGRFYPWCNATVTIHSRSTGQIRDFDLDLNGNGSTVELVVHEWDSTWVNVTFNSSRFPVDKKSVKFHSAQGGKYVLFVWASYRQLKVKYRIVQVMSPFAYTFYLALPQIVCRALSIAFTDVSILSLVQINVVPSFAATTWAFLFHSKLAYFPVFVAFMALEMREWTYQIFFAVVNALNIVIVLLVMRIARYK